MGEELFECQSCDYKTTNYDDLMSAWHTLGNDWDRLCPVCGGLINDWGHPADDIHRENMG